MRYFTIVVSFGAILASVVHAAPAHPFNARNFVGDLAGIADKELEAQLAKELAESEAKRIAEEEAEQLAKEEAGSLESADELIGDGDSRIDIDDPLPESNPDPTQSFTQMKKLLTRNGQAAWDAALERGSFDEDFEKQLAALPATDKFAVQRMRDAVADAWSKMSESAQQEFKENIYLAKNPGSSTLEPSELQDAIAKYGPGGELADAPEAKGILDSIQNVRDNVDKWWNGLSKGQKAAVIIVPSAVVGGIVTPIVLTKVHSGDSSTQQQQQQQEQTEEKEQLNEKNAQEEHDAELKAKLHGHGVKPKSGSPA